MARRKITPKPFYTTREVADIAGVTVNTIRNDQSKELITPTKKDGCKNLYSFAELREYLSYLGQPIGKDGRPVRRGDRMRKMVHNFGIEYTATHFGIKVGSVKRNVRNWRRQGRWPLKGKRHG